LSVGKHYHIVIIGGGILGCSIAYLLSYNLGLGTRIILIEQEAFPALHASSRNTGKVHAPFLYDPSKRKLFAKSAAIGFEMLSDYCKSRHLPFIKDGILEVAIDENGTSELHKYLEWGYSNGLSQEELQYLDGREVTTLEPNVRCTAAIYCTRDASVNYGEITRSLLVDSRYLGCEVMLGAKVVAIRSGSMTPYVQQNFGDPHQDLIRQRRHDIRLKVLQTRRIPKTTYSASTQPESLSDENIAEYMKLSQFDKQRSFLIELSADYVINVAGGAALGIAHSMGLATGFSALYFRGEYWVAPSSLRNLTKRSIYSVPRYPEYPFLDPHWIVRIDGRREVGPNAVLVSGPFAYNWKQNMRTLLPKILESITDAGRAGLVSLFMDKKFVTLALHEFRSSLSKKVMINRAKRFLPSLDPSLFNERGTSGIRSSLIDLNGRFVPDIIIAENDYSVHMLNYNSPGATGALPVAALIVDRIMKQYKFRLSTRSESDKNIDSAKDHGPVTKWDINYISNRLTGSTD
jgi:L-2-hydroxyglutarate oxidase